MNAAILLTSNGGFGRNWSLLVTGEGIAKNFFLGQDSKFCNRVLGMTSGEVVKEIGTNDITEGTEGNKKLADLIIGRLELDEKKIAELQSWELCCQ